MTTDTIIFIDPLGSYEGDFKSESTFTDYTFNGDISQLKPSLVTISKNSIVDIGDIFIIPSKPRISGIVAKVDSLENTSHQTLTLYVGNDVYTNDVLMIDNTLVPNITENNNMPYEVSVTGSSSVVATDNLLPLDSLSRQLMRKQPCTRRMFQNGCNIEYDEDPKVIEFRLDDPIIDVNTMIFASDQFNTLRLYNMDDLSQVNTYYMHNDGSVDDGKPDKKRVQILKTMKVEAENWNSLDYASSILKSQNYSNEIEFVIPIINDIGLDFDEYLLGRKVKVYIDGYLPLETIVSAFRITDAEFMTITLGLSKSRMTDYINKEA